MKEEYKTCPYCHNMVDKKDKQCPYCLKSLWWLSGSVSYTPNTQSYNPKIEGYGSNNDTIRDDKQQKKNWELSPFFQKFLDLQKESKAWDKQARKQLIRYAIIFYVLLQSIPAIIKIIKSFFWE